MRKRSTIFSGSGWRVARTSSMTLARREWLLPTPCAFKRLLDLTTDGQDRIGRAHRFWEVVANPLGVQVAELRF